MLLVVHQSQQKIYNNKLTKFLLGFVPGRHIILSSFLVAIVILASDLRLEYQKFTS